MARAVDAIAAAAPDAVQLAPGRATLLQDRPGRTKPALVLRTDTTNVYGCTLPARPWARLLDDAVACAVRLAAAAVVVNLLAVPTARPCTSSAWPTSRGSAPRARGPGR